MSGTSAPSGRRILWLILVAALAFRVYLFLSIAYSADDALITFRYAANLADGKGFVYNEGQRVLGTTTPLFALLIAGLLKLGVSPFVSAFVLNAAADCLTAVVLAAMFASVPSVAAWIPAAAFLFSPETLQWSLSGMETEFVVAFLFVAFYLASRDSWKAAFAAGALATLARVDAAASLVALTAAYAFRRRSLPLLPMLTGAAVLLPWVVFALLYFGSPIPNSAAAKFALSGRNHLEAGARILLIGFLHLNTYGALLLIPAVAGTVHVARKRPEWLPVAVWTWGYACSYALAAGPMHPWYYAPFYAGLLPLVWAGIVSLAERFRSGRMAAAAAGVFAIAIVLATSYYRVNTIRGDQQGINAVNRGVGEWLAANTPPGAVVALKDIGFSGYYSQRRVLDLAGLVSPECVPYRVRQDFLGPIRDFRPGYFAFSEGQLRNLDLQSAGLPALYEQATVIRRGEGAYVVFKLR